MESVQILSQANTEEVLPGDWLVFPLQRQKVLIGILGWIFGACAGGLLFIFMAPIMIPHNYQNGILAAIFSTVILGIVVYVCLGSIWALITDIMRVRAANKHIIIITPEDFVKQEGKKVVHVPLAYVKHVTARGVAPISNKEQNEQEVSRPEVGTSVGSLFIGQRAASGIRQGVFARRRVRTPTTLAFIDSRSEKEIIVVTDKSYGDPYEIGEILKEYVQNAAIK
ncbi:MAG TPA: hypothetical protein VGD98_10685 [Ktedonobacteraceae bacterium]